MIRGSGFGCPIAEAGRLLFVDLALGALPADDDERTIRFYVDTFDSELVGTHSLS